MKFHDHVSIAKRFIFSLLFLLLSVLGLVLSRHTEGFGNWYTSHIYPLFVNTVGRFFGLFPFSVVELLLYAFVIFWPAYLLRTLWLTLKQRRKGPLKNFILNLTLCASALFCSYVLCCGINYTHTSFSVLSGITAEAYSTEELQALCSYLTEQVNVLSTQVARDEEHLMVNTLSVPSSARAAMYHLGTLYPEMEGFYPNPKPLLFSEFLSMQSLSGIYVPFTVEANYNHDMADYHIPFSACHELSHLRGFMQEEEANFLAFLGCIYYDEPSFQYSGYLVGWTYASNELYKRDSAAYWELYQALSEDIRADLAANNAFWKRYEGPVAEVSNQVNDRYLKSNGQTDGVQSYNHIVGLMAAWYAAQQ